MLMSADDTRARAIEAGARALRDWMGYRVATESLRRKVAAVVDAVEPIIRADERAETIREEMALRRRVLLNLRAQVEALPSTSLVSAVEVWNGEYVVRLRDVLALLDGESNG
jgi:hypothetical protein